MRYAPKFLTPWQRIDRQIEARCYYAKNELRGMAAEARVAIDKILPRPTPQWTYLPSYHDLIAQAGQMTHLEMQRLANIQQTALALAPASQYTSVVLGGVGSILGGLFCDTPCHCHHSYH